MNETRVNARLPLGFDFVVGHEELDDPRNPAEGPRAGGKIPGPWEAKLVARFFHEGVLETLTVRFRQGSDEFDRDVATEPATELDRILAEELAVVQQRDAIRREAANVKAAADEAEAVAKVPLEKALEALAEEPPPEGFLELADGFAAGFHVAAWERPHGHPYDADTYVIRVADPAGGTLDGTVTAEVSRIDRLRDGGTTTIEFTLAGEDARLIFPRSVMSDTDRTPRFDFRGSIDRLQTEEEARQRGG